MSDDRVAPLWSDYERIALSGIKRIGHPGEAAWGDEHLAFNLPCVLIPILLLIRMRKPLRFTRGF